MEKNKKKTGPFTALLAFLFFVYLVGKIGSTFSEAGSTRSYKRKTVSNQTETELLVTAKKIPATMYQANIDVYKKLVSKCPDNKKYKDKVNYYTAKLKKQRLEAQAITRTYGEKPNQSSWDSSYYEVEKYLKRIARDPSSIKIAGCTEVRLDRKKGWVVGCDFHGRNGFGGINKESKWFVINKGIVVEVLPATTYQQ